MPLPIEPARPDDLAQILHVMSYFNMHHVPGPEMGELDLSCFHVARAPTDREQWPAAARNRDEEDPAVTPAQPGEVIAACGYTMIAAGRGKTTLLGVHPHWFCLGLGGHLQDSRVHTMRSLGARTVLTNADRPESIAWYLKHYGYRVIGRIAKIADFGLSSVDFWTTLEMNLDEYYAQRADDPLPADAPALVELPPLASHYEFEPWDGTG